MKSGHSNVLREGKSRDSALLLIECSVFLVIPVAQSNVPIMGAKDGIFGSPTIPWTKSVPPIYLGREVLYPTHDTELSVRSWSSVRTYLTACEGCHKTTELHFCFVLFFSIVSACSYKYTSVCSNILSFNSHYLYKSSPIVAFPPSIHQGIVNSFFSKYLLNIIVVFSLSLAPHIQSIARSATSFPSWSEIRYK